MIDQWRKERAQLDGEIHKVRTYIETSPNRNQYSSSRAKIRILLNDLCVRRMKLHQQILKYEDEQKLEDIVKNISGMSDVEAQRLMRDLERLRLVKVG